MFKFIESANDAIFASPIVWFLFRLLSVSSSLPLKSLVAVEEQIVGVV